MNNPAEASNDVPLMKGAAPVEKKSNSLGSTIFSFFNSNNSTQQQPSSHSTSATTSTSSLSQYPMFTLGIETLKSNLKDHSVVSYAGYSMKGENPFNPDKPNQDRMIMHEDILTKTIVFACLDGHGPNGHIISEFFRDQLLAHLFNHPVFLLDVEAAVRDTLKRIELNLFHKLPGLAEYSGTTLSMAIVRGSDIWAVNVGDSRIVLATKTPQSSGPSSSSSSSVSSPTQSTHSVHSTGSSMASSRKSSESRMSTDSSNFQWRYVAQDVTIDHKPHLPVEFARITSAGGRVFAIRYDNGEVGPPRVWLGTSNVPGLAMSRSLGDFMVHSVGVISTPDVFHYQLDNDCDCFLIVGTDGLWDTVKSQEAVNIVKAFDEAGKAVEGILRISHQRWMDHDHVSDDTSLCIVHLRGFTSSKMPR